MNGLDTKTLQTRINHQLSCSYDSLSPNLVVRSADRPTEMEQYNLAEPSQLLRQDGKPRHVDAGALLEKLLNGLKDVERLPVVPLTPGLSGDCTST